MTEFEIQSGVPVPSVQKETKYPWADMKDGDCVILDEEAGQAASQSARHWVSKHRPGMSVITRTIQNTDGPNQFGIWFVVQDEAEAEDADEPDLGSEGKGNAKG